MLKKQRPQVISVKKKISHKNYLKLSHINPSRKPSFTVFSFLLKETGTILISQKLAVS